MPNSVAYRTFGIYAFESLPTGLPHFPFAALRAPADRNDTYGVGGDEPRPYDSREM
jgi:hypothetical protein